MSAARLSPGARQQPRGAGLRIAPLLGIAAVAGALACGDPYLHTNPYDPAYPVSVTILGPDTLFSYQEVGTYGALIVPAFPDSSVQFASSDSIVFPPAGHGGFRSNAPPLWPATRSVTISGGVGAIDTLAPTAGSAVGPAPHITVWRHSARKVVVLTQRVTSIQLRCPDTHACDTLSAGGTWSVWVDGRDALNQLIVALHSASANPATGTPVATFAIRDTTVATLVPVGIRAATVTARGSGTTWVVAARGALLDSLPLVVK